MRALDPAFDAHLKSGATTLCHCWRVTRRDGAVLGFTDHDRALVFDGAAFEPETGADGAAMTASADLAVDNTEIEGALRSDRLSAADLAAGRYDGARVEIWRVNWADVDQRLLLRRGVIGEVRAARGPDGETFAAEIRGQSSLLDRPSGRVYQRQCDALLGDARCGVDIADSAFGATGVVAAVIDEQRFTASGLAGFEDGWFEHGRLDWTSGANQDLSAFVKTHARAGEHASVTLWLPAGAPIKVGDAFAIIAGCDKRHETCRDKFSNLVNFRGFHLMPGNDFAVSYPARGEALDGGRRR